MYKNGKMKDIKTIPEIGGGGIKENDGRGEFNYDILLDFWECHNAPAVQQ
jgi:hypothetical protein